MNNNIEVMKSVWRRVERPSALKLRRIKAKAELEARVTLRYMALLAAVMTMLMMAFAPMVHGQDVGLAVFNYTDASGKKQSVDVVDKYYPKKIVQPIAKAMRRLIRNCVGPPLLPRNAHVPTRFPSAGVL